MGYVRDRPTMWRMEAFTHGSAATWERFLGSLPGAPPRVVCDLHDGQLRGVVNTWPQTEVYFCEWHLQHALDRLFTSERRRNPQHTITALEPRIERAFDGAHFWRAFVRDIRAVGIPAFEEVA